MHTAGYEDEEIPALVSYFLSVVCPVAQVLAAEGRWLAVHWRESYELLRLVPANAMRAVLPPEACASGNVDHWFRLGWLAYGTDRVVNSLLQVGGQGSRAREQGRGQQTGQLSSLQARRHRPDRSTRQPTPLPPSHL
jgi:hypothetical protein